MNKFVFPIPSHIGYLSNYPNLDSSLPGGKIIVNKVICGCGMTHYYLSNDLPVILISPRKNLILSKVHDSSLTNLHYFDRSDKTRVKEESIYKLQTYLSNPFQSPGFIPKILVTYDSFPKVIPELIGMGCLTRFTLVIDEFTCLFTDARLKGLTDIRLVRQVLSLPNRTVFISATPIKEAYLDELSEFKNVTYVTLEWDPRRVRQISIHESGMKSTRSAISDIIDNFRKNGYFQSKEINGSMYYSREAVFFLNSISDIISIVKKKGLTSKDTRVVCADGDDNRRKLKKYKLKVGCFPSKIDYQKENKTFTFVTKASFEGADLYSDSASTYIFADSNRDNLSIDISIDFTQIIGRCRTMNNPFIDDVFYYYKTTDKHRFDYQKQCDIIQNRYEKSEENLIKYGNSNDNDLLETFEDAQKYRKYGKDYIDVDEDSFGNKHLIFNKLVYLSDIRALEIKNNQYQNPQTLMLYLSGNGYNLKGVSTTPNNPYDIFRISFNQEQVFEKKLEMLIDAIQSDPYIENSVKNDPSFPSAFKDYAFTLGPTICAELAYNERKIQERLILTTRSSEIVAELSNFLQAGNTYSKSDVKEALRLCYDKLSIELKAKANQLLQLIPTAKEINYNDSNGKRTKGYLI